MPDCPLMPFLFLQFSSELHNSLFITDNMPPSFKLWSIMATKGNASSQTFYQTTWKNSDTPTVNEALNNKNETSTISAQLPTVIVNPYWQQPMHYSTHLHMAKQPPSLSQLIQVDQDPCFGSVRQSVPVLLCPQLPPKVCNVVADANAFADSIKTILCDAVCKVLQEEVERQLAPCLLEIESRLIDLLCLGKT